MNCERCPFCYEENVAVCGSCTVWENNHTDPIGRKHAYRRSMKKRTFLRLFTIYRSTYYLAIHSDKEYDQIFAPEDVKYFGSAHRSTINVSLKRQGNRKVRHARDLAKGNSYCKCFELQWTLD